MWQYRVYCIVMVQVNEQRGLQTNGGVIVGRAFLTDSTPKTLPTASPISLLPSLAIATHLLLH
jgi:hypothetical protein